MGKKTKELADLEPKEVARINEALIAKYGVKLEPGESLSLDIERSSEHAHAQLTLSNADDTFRLELEAAILESDETEGSEVVPSARHLIAVDFLDAILEEYFSEDRHANFHDDWRVLEFETTNVRFRGGERRPSIEAMADAWLEAGGNPDEV